MKPMCSNKTCPKLEALNQCWRANCPPEKVGQKYRRFEPEQDDDEGFFCSNFIEAPEIGEDG